MKHLILLGLMLILAYPACAGDEFSAPEAQCFFAQEEIWQDQQESAREIHPIMEEKKPQEEILLNDTSSFQYKIGVKKIKRLGVHDIEKRQVPDSLSFKYKNLRFDSYGSKGVDSSILTDTFSQKSNLSYTKGILDLSGGIENYYGSADLMKASQSFYFAPKLNITQNASLRLNNRIDPKNNDFYQELGVNYTPSFLKNSSFGVLGGVKYDGNGNNKSERLKFNTSFYLW